MSHSPLSFEVCVASSEADLRDACRVREQAYGHHLGDEAVSGFGHADKLDRAPGTVVLLCRDKATGQAIGTARIHPNAPRLLVERNVILPHRIAASPRAEVTRLAVLPGASPLVKLSLIKSVYLYCEAEGVDWLVICARSEALSRHYRALGFKDFLAKGEMLPLAYAGNIPHFVFTMNVPQMRAQWLAEGHRLQGFMFEMRHPDLPRFQPRPDRAPVPRHLVQ
jgi:hypothetical protein